MVNLWLWKGKGISRSSSYSFVWTKLISNIWYFIPIWLNMIKHNSSYCWWLMLLIWYNTKCYKCYKCYCCLTAVDICIHGYCSKTTFEHVLKCSTLCKLQHIARSTHTLHCQVTCELLIKEAIFVSTPQPVYMNSEPFAWHKSEFIPFLCAKWNKLNYLVF